MRSGHDIVVLGLSLSSSWGNGHATTYRALLRGLAELNQRVLFLERNVPWYAAHRDLASPSFCEFRLYDTVDELRERYEDIIANAGAVIVGSYVPDGVKVIDTVLAAAQGVTAFYDIDTPITLAALARGDSSYIAPRQISRLDVYLSFTGGPALSTLRARYGAIRPLAFYCAVDDAAYRPQETAHRYDLGYLGTYSPDRQPALEKLLLAPARALPNHRFAVAGPQYPADITWPENVDRIEHLPPTDHPLFYSSQRYTLNITRADMIKAGWSPSVRLFEAAACGAPIISDRWDGLSDLLPENQAVLIADSTEDVIAALTAQDESRRISIAEAARDIVLQAHTGTARARQLLDLFAEARAGGRVPARGAA